MKIKNKLIYYLVFTLIWLLYSVAFFGMAVISMVYILNSVSWIDIAISILIMVLAYVGLVCLNSLALDRGKLLRIKNHAHIIIWNMLVILTYILLYFTL